MTRYLKQLADQTRNPVLRLQLALNHFRVRREFFLMQEEWLQMRCARLNPCLL